MKLAEAILKNERTKELNRSKALVEIKLKELVSKQSDWVTTTMHKSGVAISVVLPKSLILSILVKHLASNSVLRESVAKKLLELDSYANADGKGLAITGGVLSALGSVLSGIGRSQNYSTDQNRELQMEKMRMEQRMEDERRRRRNTGLFVGIGLVVVIGIVIAVKSSKAKEVAKLKTA